MRNITTTFFCLVSLTLSAQAGYKHLNLTTGLTMEGNHQHTIALELNNGYYNAWDIVVEAHISEYDQSLMIPETDPPEFVPSVRKEEIFQAGAYYKPLLKKNKNLMFHFRTGLLLGRSQDVFLISAGGGFELTYIFAGQFGVFLQQNNHYIINVPKRFRHSLSIGIKIPL